MKNIIIILLSLLSLSATAQVNILTPSAPGFMVNGNLFPLNSLALSVPTGDTTVAGIYSPVNNRVYVFMSKISTYGRANGVAFANRQALINYYDSFMVSTNGWGIDTTSLSDRIDALAGGGGSSVNIYNSDGTLTGDRTVDGAGGLLYFENLNEFLVDIGSGHIDLYKDGPADENGYLDINDGSGDILETDWSNLTTTIGHGAVNMVFDDIADKITTNSELDVVNAIGMGSSRLQATGFSATSGDRESDITLGLNLNIPRIRMENANGKVTIALSTSGTTINFSPPKYANDADAITDGLESGDWYQNSVTFQLTTVQ
jgi:hypothetical protein